MSNDDVLPIQPAPGPIFGTVKVPGSKSFSNRALPIAALAAGQSRLNNLLDSEDTQVMIDSLHRLGIETVRNEDGSITVNGCGGAIPVQSANLFLANSGTSIRFLTALVSLATGRFTLDGIARMRERPIADLLEALQQWGVNAKSTTNTGCPPVEVNANGLAGGSISIRGNISSQYLSALLMAAPYAKNPVSIAVDGPLVSIPYVSMTLATMEAFDVTAEHDEYQCFRFPGSQVYRATDYNVEPDASAASYFFGAAAVTNGKVAVTGLGTKSLQGDLNFVRVLEQMGCNVSMTATETSVTGTANLTGGEFDMGDISDTVPTLAAVACCANSATRIYNVKHIRVKETDRIAALVTELRKAGLEVDEFDDGLTIHPAPIKPTTFDTYNDHRMAMSLTLLGLVRDGVRIRNPGCTAKTYPRFFEDLAQLVVSKVPSPQPAYPAGKLPQGEG